MTDDLTLPTILVNAGFRLLAMVPHYKVLFTMFSIAGLDN
jgi:hypothetical protein